MSIFLRDPYLEKETDFYFCISLSQSTAMYYFLELFKDIYAFT